MAGYSGTPLAAKLGIKPGYRVASWHAPHHFIGLLAPLPSDVRILSLRARNLDLIVLFTTQRAELEDRLLPAAHRMKPDGALWVSWPKRSSGVDSDMTEDVGRTQHRCRDRGRQCRARRDGRDSPAGGGRVSPVPRGRSRGA